MQHHVIRWLFPPFLMLAAVRGQETVAGPDTLEQEARQLAQQGKHGTLAAGPVSMRLWRQGKELEVQVQLGPIGVLLGRGNAKEAHGLGYGDGKEKEDEDRRLLLRESNLRNLGGLSRLPGTAAECRAIAGAFAGTEDLKQALASPRVTVLLDQDATEATLYRVAPSATYLHLATHGIADEVAQASFSALALTMPARPSPDDNGYLDLHDLLHRWRDRLANCRMVVLSACRTMVGPQQKGEAIHALPIGFLHAGASSVIASLWSVNDASTAALMSDFYRRLATPEGAADRLRAFWEARKVLRKDPRYADPFHWAAFLYFGSPQ